MGGSRVHGPCCLQVRMQCDQLLPALVPLTSLSYSHTLNCELRKLCEVASVRVFFITEQEKKPGHFACKWLT